MNVERKTVTPQDATDKLNDAYRLISEARWHIAPRRGEDDRDVAARREQLRQAMVLVRGAM